MRRVCTQLALSHTLQLPTSESELFGKCWPAYSPPLWMLPTTCVAAKNMALFTLRYRNDKDLRLKSSPKIASSEDGRKPTGRKPLKGKARNSKMNFNPNYKRFRITREGMHCLNKCACTAPEWPSYCWPVPRQKCALFRSASRETKQSTGRKRGVITARDSSLSDFDFSANDFRTRRCCKLTSIQNSYPKHSVTRLETK